MIKQRLLSLMLAAAFVPFTACGSDKVAAPDLSSAQVADMMDALAVIGSFGFLPTGASANRIPAAASAVPVPINETEPCPAGGTSHVQGTVDVTATESAMSYAVDLTQTFNNCAGTSESGTTWTFNGAPNTKLQMTGNYNMNTGNISMVGTQKGTFRFSSTAGTGTCGIDVSFNFTVNVETEAETGTMTGTVCGQSVNQTL